MAYIYWDTLMSYYESNYPTDIESITVLHQKMCESEIAFNILVWLCGLEWNKTMTKIFAKYDVI